MNFHAENVYHAFYKQTENHFMHLCLAKCRDEFRQHLIDEVLYSLLVMLHNNDKPSINRNIEGLWQEYATTNGIEYVADETYNWTEEETPACPPEPDCPPDDDEDYEDLQPMLKKYIIPNFYEQWHFTKMDDWSPEKVQDFKDYLARQLCAFDQVKHIVDEWIDLFEDDYNN